jgi:hypothetical protein
MRGTRMGAAPRADLNKEKVSLPHWRLSCKHGVFPLNLSRLPNANTRNRERKVSELVAGGLQVCSALRLRDIRIGEGSYREADLRSRSD